MTYLADKWIWFSFAAGFAGIAVVLILAALLGLATIVMFRKKIPVVVSAVWSLMAAIGSMVFEVHYAGFARAHFQHPVPYLLAWVGGCCLAFLFGFARLVPMVSRVTAAPGKSDR